MEIEFQHSQNSQEAYDKVKSMVTPELLEKYGVKADFEYQDDQKVIVGKGKGFDLKVQFTEKSLKLDLNLALLLRPFKSKVLASLERKISKVI